VEGKMMNTVRFLGLLFAALALAPALAHLLELPNKIDLPRDEYLTVQQIYRGSALLGFIVAGALCSTLALTMGVFACDERRLEPARSCRADLVRACKGRFGDEEFSMKGVDHAKPR
jgi:hypothetical protein